MDKRVESYASFSAYERRNNTAGKNHFLEAVADALWKVSFWLTGYLAVYGRYVRM
ncbi:hypothetical protein Hdeb2414_s0197g00830061 [Helianthus debilis subsp. tardiflorus]